ncbi:uncharacterized protein LOC130625818 [Hydractinia symbiolongicarpus]|uniref:uncharacterized protein LOC130625818 n=1 Tax=Hydractinia symbiolongicarpus TaxID=13093 RepID=UPI00254DE2F0|nr:uncharacterized protein LOC130625818 [Hydractinia symbiolongicarpus]
MPKKKKNESADPNEGKPKNLTLGDFIVVKTKKNDTKHTTSSSLLEERRGEEQFTEASGACSVDVTDCTKDTQHKEENLDSSKIYFVCRTKKGGVPVKVESRASGKKVTLVEHVGGDGKALVQILKNKFGTGGFYKDDFIELQGDFKLKVTKYLNDNKQLLRPYGTKC